MIKGNSHEVSVLNYFQALITLSDIGHSNQGKKKEYGTQEK